MPTIESKGATIYFEEHGSGFPVLTFAPAGVLSTIAVWSQPMAPIKPVADFTGFRVIVMDQRNAGGKSRAPMTAQDSWHGYTSDHIAVLDHLKIDKCHLYGQCIGGTFIANLIKAQPQRVAAAVWAQPIGRVGPFKPERPARFNDWINGLKKDHPELTEAIADSIYRNMYEPGFIYCADREFAKNCRTPSLLLAGNDEAHPRPISDELSKLLPNVEYILEWKDGAALAAAKPRVLEFLKKHTPATAKA
jgi:pimeloyl-ACP methyl ester carboxylesterase